MKMTSTNAVLSCNPHQWSTYVNTTNIRRVSIEYNCGYCGTERVFNGESSIENTCPNCGAKMRRSELWQTY